MPGFFAPHGGTIPPHILVSNLKQIRFWLQDFIRKEQEPMLVNKQLGYKNNSNLANNVEIDEGYKQKKNYSFKSLFSLFSYEMFGCLFTLLNSDLKI